MYPKYQTEAILIYSYPVKERDKGYILYTKSFGLLHALASSVRAQKSKLKSKLSSYILLEPVLLRAKSGWKLIEVSSVKIPVSYLSSEEARFVYELFKIVLKNSAQEERNERLFDVLSSVLFLVPEARKLKDEKYLSDLKLACTYEILASLGYADTSLCFVGNKKFDTSSFSKYREHVIRSIKEAEEKSHIFLI